MKREIHWMNNTPGAGGEDFVWIARNNSKD